MPHDNPQPVPPEPKPKLGQPGAGRKGGPTYCSACPAGMAQPGSCSVLAARCRRPPRVAPRGTLLGSDSHPGATTASPAPLGDVEASLHLRVATPCSCPRPALAFHFPCSVHTGTALGQLDGLRSAARKLEMARPAACRPQPSLAEIIPHAPRAHHGATTSRPPPSLVPRAARATATMAPSLC